MSLKRYHGDCGVHLEPRLSTISTCGSHEPCKTILWDRISADVGNCSSMAFITQKTLLR